ncbi:MAG: phosphoglucosamine mutase [Coriobacteriia bacterium]|nr:phosphoglucosamine mutase [Coriobacteriia bacterium]
MLQDKPLAREQASAQAFDPSTIRFGTDGWRAIIGQDFTVENLARVALASAKVFKEDNPTNNDGKQPLMLVGYDCRENASTYALIAAVILTSQGFDVLLSDNYCPTPTLCWSIAQNPAAVGGLMLTSSHNPAEYLGVKLRMRDGGASPQSFSNRVEEALSAELPEVFDEALAVAQTLSQLDTAELQASMQDASEQAGEGQEVQAGQAGQAGRAESARIVSTLEIADFMQPYLAELESLVDKDALAAAKLRVVVDPMYGAGRGYLADLLRKLGVEVEEINSAADPSFAGLHPEPIPPWVNDGLAKTAELSYDACFITDGDADRIGAGSRDGSFVNPHKILALICDLLVEDKGQKGRVIRTISGSSLIKRQCERLGLELTTTPVGFKWIYEEMLKGDVMLGGEESGGMGIPTHVRERDGLLMALLLAELMAKKGKDLGALVDELHDTLGYLDYSRNDLRLTEEQKETFLAEVCAKELGTEVYQPRFDAADEQITSIDYRDGIKFEFASDAWLLARPSGTEPLVRVYVEAATTERVEQLQEIGCAIVKGE